MRLENHQRLQAEQISSRAHGAEHGGMYSRQNQTHLEEELQIASLDKRLREVAAGFGLRLQPDH